MNHLPTVHLTAQDFVSTFPWGLRSDEVRVRQQEVESLLLDAESAAALAVMLGDSSYADRLDEAWTTLLNSQNHDIHVCTQEEAGIAWCEEARPMAKTVLDEAARFIADQLGGAVTLNPTAIVRTDAAGNRVPAFGFRKAAKVPDAEEAVPWTDWFDAGAFQVKRNGDGTFTVKAGRGEGTVGLLSVEIDGKRYCSSDNPPTAENAVLSGASASVNLSGRLGGNGEIGYTHRITVTRDGIDYETEFDYGDGVNFGPDIKDFEAEPRRTHYFQHERKLCMNFSLGEEKAEFLYNSPFLTWPAAKDARSVESVGWAAVEGERMGIAHFNVGQGGYAKSEPGNAASHVLCFSPHDYIYGKADKITARGKHIHRYRFVPYAGGWRQAEIGLRADLYGRSLIPAGEADREIAPASLLGIRSNSTKVSALFERGGAYWLRLAEWAGQEDEVSLTFGDGAADFAEVTHALAEIGPFSPVFRMRPWEVKTVRLRGKAALLSADDAPTHRTFGGLPAGWERKSQFECPTVEAKPRKKSGILYFAAGYHDGFVRPMERHSKTMAIEMERTKKYDGYSQYWELGGSCWVRMGVNEPSYLAGLKEAVRENRLEVIGGTWCEPFSLIISGESNIRQMFYGMRAIEDNLGYHVTIYGNQEHGTYAQMPQILRSFGLYAVVNRTQWAPYGYESAVDADAVRWIGPDGTDIAMIPRYRSMDYNNCPWDDRNLQNGSVTGHNRVWRTREKFEEMLRNALDHGIERPLMTMLEDIWADFLRTTDEEIEFYDSLPFVQFISLTKYLSLCGIEEKSE